MREDCFKKTPLDLLQDCHTDLGDIKSDILRNLSQRLVPCLSQTTVTVGNAVIAEQSKPFRIGANVQHLKKMREV